MHGLLERDGKRQAFTDQRGRGREGRGGQERGRGGERGVERGEGGERGVEGECKRQVSTDQIAAKYHSPDSRI